MYERGTILQDREENSQVIVVRVDARRSDEVVVNSRDPEQNRYADQTVFSFNSRYDYVSPEDPVVHAVYLNSLPTDPTELSKEGRATLARNAEVKEYAFPISRLRLPDE